MPRAGLDKAQDYEEVVTKPEGIYLVRHRYLSEKVVKARRVALRREIAQMRAKLAGQRATVESSVMRLDELEAQLRSLSTLEVEDWFREQERARVEALRRAEDLLKEYLGDEAYGHLRKTGWLDFEARDGVTYRIDAKGCICRKEEGGTMRVVCMIKKQGLPLPDYILAALVSVKEEPGRFRATRGWMLRRTMG